MRYGSVCSGIEAASVAWHPLGWKAAFLSEIEPFPCSVLAHHYPSVPNLGDMTKFKEWNHAAIDVLVGGTPCQSFSVAGLRKGLDDPRGNLMLTYLAIADRYRPHWLVWENVPGVLSSNGGRDFGTFLGGLGQLGYGFAYRVLDAQYFGVAQRRRRVFVVGCLGDWRGAAAVLFERHSLQGNTPPRREKGQKAAGNVAIGIDEECNATLDSFGPLLRGGQGGTHAAVATFDRQSSGEYGAQPIASTISARYYKSPSDLVCMAKTYLAFNVDAKPDEMRFDPHVSAALTRSQHSGVATFGGDIARTLSARYDSSPCADRGMDVVATGMKVRRLTPLEYERLQGFPDFYTQVPHRGLPFSKDGPRYKALGNSMAVPVMGWIGQRIAAVDSLL